jgi:hypothetical protein
MEFKKSLKEADAALAFAKAWNLLDPAVFIKLLHPDGCYESQWVFDVLKGKEAIADYLIAKMETVRNSPNTVYAELGKISYLQCQPTLGEAGQDCVILAQGDKDDVKCVVTFEILDNQIHRIDVCMPQLFNVNRSGVYPSDD